MSTQPQHVLQTVVVHPGASQFALQQGRKWHSGHCDLCHDFGACFEIMFCRHCQIGYQRFFTQRGHPGIDTTSCCCTLCFDVCFLGLPSSYCAYTIRQNVIRRYYLSEEGPCTTCCVGCCCSSCSLCQTFREMNGRGEFPGACCIAPPPFAMPPPPSEEMYERGIVSPRRQQQQQQRQPPNANNNNPHVPEVEEVNSEPYPPAAAAAHTYP